MKTTALIILIFTTTFAFSQSRVRSELDSLAGTLGLEFVHGEKFPLVNPYGSYGAPAVFNFLNTSHKSVLFLCREKKEYYTKKNVEDVYDLIRHYDYSLVFALKLQDGTYKIHNVFSEEMGLKGMALYYGCE